jgi:hypothetical protein
MKNLSRRTALALLLVLAAAPCASAQTTATQELLALVPKEFGFCAVLGDLRGNGARLEQQPWFKALKASPLGQTVLAAPEFRDLGKLEQDLKKHLDVDWPTIRDDLLGDAVVFAYRPPAPGHKDEYGLVLLKARRADVLSRLVDRLNELQRQSGELKSLDVRQHQGVSYHRRVHDKNTHYYLQRGPILAVSAREEVIQAVIDNKDAGSAPIHDALRRAGADKALAALWLNPRMFDAELEAKAQKDIGAEGKVLSALLTYWRALDGIVLAADVHEHLEARFTLLARPADLPAAARKWFERPVQPSALWQHFPANSILAVAGRTDFDELFSNLAELAPAKQRKDMLEGVGKTLKAALGLDPFKQGLPNIGPDWGLCVLPAADAAQFPQAVAALAVKPPADQAIYKALQFFVNIGLFEHNRTHDQPIQLRTLQQGPVEIKHLANDELFPAGFQPALALKDGYLMLATSPAAVAAFKRHDQATHGDDVPLVRFAPAELAQSMRQHRSKLIEHTVQKQNVARAAAEQQLDQLTQVLDVFERATLSLRVQSDQIAWVLRVHMAR